MSSKSEHTDQPKFGTIIPNKGNSENCPHDWLVPSGNRTCCKLCGRDGFVTLDTEAEGIINSLKWKIGELEKATEHAENNPANLRVKSADTFELIKCTCIPNNTEYTCRPAFMNNFLQNKIKELEQAEVSRIEYENSNDGQKIQWLQAHIQELEQEIARLQSDITLLDNSVIHFENEVDELKAENARLKNEVERLENMVRENDHYTMNIKAELEEWQKEYPEHDYWKRESVSLKAKNEKLVREIEVLRQYGNKDCTAQADEYLEENGHE